MRDNVFFIEYIKLFIKFVLVDLPRQRKFFVTPIIYNYVFFRFKKISPCGISLKLTNMYVTINTQLQTCMYL